MRFRTTLRILAGLVYLGILAAVVGAVLSRLTAFEGNVAVALHRAESLALHRHSGKASFSVTRNMPLDVLPFDNPRAARALFDNRTAYDAVSLGLRLRLESVEVLSPPSERDVLKVIGPSAPAVDVEARAGAVLETSAGPCTVTAVEPWAGLVRQASGRRMAAFSFQRNGEVDWTQGLFAEAGEWTVLPPEMAVRFDWDDSEEEAKAGLPPARPGLDAARWSVAEKGRVHWFDGVNPGTGETLSDGTEYLLLAVNTPEGKPPALTVGVKKAGKARKVEVPANAAAPVEGMRFEYPGAMPLVVVARAWRDGGAWVESFGPERDHAPTRMEEGTAWEASPNLRFRLDQVMSQAVPVGTRGAPVWMAAASLPGGETLRLREGMAVRHEDLSFLYRRVPQPPVVRYAFQARSLSGEPIGTFTLGPGEKARVRDWIFSQADGNLAAATTALLTAKRLPATRYGMLGLLLAAVGAAGWVFAQLRLRRSDHEPPWTECGPGSETPPHTGPEPQENGAAHSGASSDGTGQMDCGALEYTLDKKPDGPS